MDSNAIKQPSIKQMLVRMEQGHMTILRAHHEGRSVETVGRSFGELRGLRTASGTLRRWGCLEGNGLGSGLTQVGEELFNAAQAKFNGARA